MNVRFWTNAHAPGPDNVTNNARARYRRKADIGAAAGPSVGVGYLLARAPGLAVLRSIRIKGELG